MDLEGVKHSVEITAGSLFEAAVIGMKAMKVPTGSTDPHSRSRSV
jgi:hypothetical protein